MYGARSSSPEGAGSGTALLSTSERYGALATTSHEMNDLHRQSRPDLVVPSSTDAGALQTAVEARRLADGAKIAIVQLKNSLEDEKARTTAEENDKDARERRHRNTWFPWLATAVIMNLMLWLSMLYAVFRISDYASHSRRSYYLAMSWVIFTVPLFIVLLLLITPYPAMLKKKRIAVGQRRRSSNYGPAISMINAFCCFTLVVVYLYASAIPQYNTPKWQPGVNFTNTISLPAFAFILSNEYFRTPADTSGTFCYDLPNDGKAILCPKAAFSGTPTELYLTSSAKPDLIVYIFNSTHIQREANTGQLGFNQALGNQVQIALNVDYSAFVAANKVGNALNLAFFDPRYNLTNQLACGLVQPINVQPVSGNNVYVSAQQITDTLGLINAPKSPMQCKEFFSSTLSQDDSQYLSYSASLSPVSNQDVSTCDSSGEVCQAVATLNYPSNIVSTIASTHSIDQLTIWLNAGAIVGGVQFFAWFLGIFNA